MNKSAVITFVPSESGYTTIQTIVGDLVYVMNSRTATYKHTMHRIDAITNGIAVTACDIYARGGTVMPLEKDCATWCENGCKPSPVNVNEGPVQWAVVMMWDNKAPTTIQKRATDLMDALDKLEEASLEWQKRADIYELEAIDSGTYRVIGGALSGVRMPYGTLSIREVIER